MARKQAEPDPGESETDFVDRCTTEMLDEDDSLSQTDAEEACQLIWDERAATPVVRKTNDAGIVSRGKDHVGFVMSDESVDRMGDVIKVDGWKLSNFKRNPIALFNHNPNFVVGKWHNLRTEDNALKGDLELAAFGTSERVDEIRRLVEAGILKAVSVGFKPLAKPEPRDGKDPWNGVTFSKQELIETSLVSVPANANALAIAKSLSTSRSTLDLVFAGQGNRDQVVTRGGSPAGKPTLLSTERSRSMSTLSKRIEEGQQRLVSLRDRLTEHLATVDDSNVTDEQMTITKELNERIASADQLVISLKDSERSLTPATTTAMTVRTTAEPMATKGGAVARPFNIAPKKVEPLEFLVRSGVVQFFSHTLKMPIDAVRERIYGDDEATRVVCDWTLKAASAPAMTTVTGWAAELVQTVNADFMATLMPSSVFPSLSAMGLGLTFGANGKINLPTRNATPTIAGSFVGEGNPIPVRQAAFSAVILTPKKMAVITTWTKEMDMHSIPAIEGLLRQAIQEDTAVSLDAVLLDANAATVVRPPGLRNGVAGLTPTAGGGFTALVGDIKALTGAILTATNGNIRKMAWLMNPMQALAISLTQAPSAIGVFPFAAEIAAGNLRGFPIIVSGTVPVGTVIAIDAADFVSVAGDTPRFEISDQATLHMEDTTPLAIGTAGSPATVAAPAMSLFQTDSLALRLIMPVNWAQRRAGTVAWVAGVTW